MADLCAQEKVQTGVIELVKVPVSDNPADVMTKYTDLLKEGKDKLSAMTTTVKEIGMATLLTSLTTAVGFATLLTSNVGPIREFGINAAVGVMIAYVTVIFFTTSLLLFFDREQIVKETKSDGRLSNWLGRCFNCGNSAICSLYFNAAPDPALGLTMAFSIA